MASLPAEDLAHVLAHGGPAWEVLRGARILLTGGTGFFGRWLVESLAHANEQLALGAELTVLSRDVASARRRMPQLATESSIRWIEGDVRTFSAPRGPLTHVIHGATATVGPLNAEQPLEMLDTIISGTRHVLDVAVATGARRVLLLGSGAVYGRQPATLSHVDESYAGAPDPLDPRHAYAEGKRVAELLGAVFQREHGIEVVAARCFAFMGPHLPLDAHFAIGNFMRDAIAGAEVHVGGDGSPMRSYLHAADLAVWLWTLLARGAASRAYNVGSSEAVSIHELAELVARIASELLHRPTTVAPHRAPDPARPAERYVPDTRRAHDELGLRAWIPLDDGIARTLAWHLQHRDAERPARHEPTCAAPLFPLSH